MNYRGCRRQNVNHIFYKQEGGGGITLKKDNVFLMMWMLLLSAYPIKAEAVKASVSYTNTQEIDAGFMQGLVLKNIDYEPKDSIHIALCNNIKSCYWSIGFVDPFGLKAPYIDSFSFAQPNKLEFEKGVNGSNVSVKDIVIAMKKKNVANVAKLGRGDYRRHQNKLCIGVFITASPDVSKSVGMLLDNSLYSCSDGSGGGGIAPPPRPPSEEVTCSTLPTIEINHGTLKSSSSIQDTKEKTVLVSCSGKVTVNFQLTPERLDLGGNITSELYIDGNAGKATLGVDKQRWVTFRSKISSSQKVLSGVYMNTAVLRMTVQ